MKSSLIALKVLLIALHFFHFDCFEQITTEQEASKIRPSTLFVQIITEPESLIRIFDGLNLSFQMLRHWGTTGSAILRLPFNRDILYENDHFSLDPWKRPFYARMLKRFPAEAPRYVRMPPKRREDISTRTNGVVLYTET